MASAFRIADRIALLCGGRIVAMAPPEEFRNLDDARVQQFIHGDAEGPLTDPREPRGCGPPMAAVPAGEEREI